MSSAAKLKKQALQHEHDRQYDKALAIYARMLDGPAAADEEVDVTLFNRVGDLALRAGDALRAVTYYERAVDLYAAGGLLNNAIALCNKILRHAPEHASSHFTLGVLHAKQGFRGDAKHHFVEYAERMHRAGRDDEALRALREFAELCAPTDDVRGLLAQHLARTGRGSAAASSLQAMLDAAGVPAIAPGAATRAADVSSPADASGEVSLDGALVFLDLAGDVPAAAAPTAARSADHAAAADRASEVDPVDFMSSALPAPVGSGMYETGAQDLQDDVGQELRQRLARRAVDCLPGELPPLAFPLAATPFERAPLAGATDGAALADSVFVDDRVPTKGDATTDLPLLDLDDPPDMIDLSYAPTAADSRADDVATWVEVDAATAPDAAPPDTPLTVRDAGRDAAGVGAPAPATESYVDLGDWLREVEPARSPRMVTADVPQTGNEAADFDRMLEAFKAGLDRNIDDGDIDSHYDLGVAFRDMGLLEEAVARFQRAARGPVGAGRPLRALEALGQCFLDLGQPELALESLRRAAGSTAGAAPPDEQLVGVLYLLGVASEHTQRPDAAAAYYRRVCAIDLQFRDAARRLAQLSPPTR